MISPVPMFGMGPRVPGFRRITSGDFEARREGPS